MKASRITACSDLVLQFLRILVPFLFMLTHLAFAPAARATPGDFLFLWGAQQHFIDPAGIAVDGNGNVYVTDLHNVQVFDSSGHRIAKWGSEGSGSGQFSHPSGIAVDGAGNVYVADTGNNRVQVLDSSGGYIRTLQHADWSARHPIAVAADGTGKVYVAEGGSGVTPPDGTVKIFGSDGVFIGQLGSLGGGSDQFQDPGGIAVDGGGNVYVADLSGRRVQVYDSAGDFQRTAVSGYVLQHGIAVDGDGNIYVNAGNSNDERTLVFSSAGALIRELTYSDGADYNGAYRYWQPIALAVDGNGNVYTLDDNNDGVRAFDSSGNQLSQWWSYGTGGNQLSRPMGIAVDSGGNVYETDTYDWTAAIFDKRVRVFSSDGTPVRQWTGTFCQTAGVAIDSLGHVHVLDTPNPDSSSCRPTSVGKVFDSSGNSLGEWGLPIETEPTRPFYELFAVAIDKNGRFIVSHPSDPSIRIFNSDGSFFQKIDWTTSPPATGIAVDSGGNIYVAGRFIRVYDSNYSYVRQWGDAGSGDGYFSNPGGVATDSYGHVFVADSGNNRVQVFDTSGNFLISWGEAGDASGQFNNPKGIAVDPSGTKVYVADTGNNRIQVFEGYGPPKYYLSGIVRQGSESGPPMAGATVSIASQSTTTSSEGTFRIEGILAGTYTLTIAKSGYATLTIPDYDVNADRSDLTLALHGYTISGTVHEGSPAGPVLEGVLVEVAGRSATTNSEGGFSIDEIPAGSYSLVIRKSGYITSTIPGFVINGNSSGLSFSLSPTYSLSGTVHHGSPSGTPVLGATVAVAGKSADTAADGSFSIDGIPDGSYTLTVSKTGYVTRTVSGYTINSNTSGAVFYMTPLCTVSGTVRESGATGAPVAGATVAIAGKSVITGSSGTFSITGIPADTYELTISKNGYVTKTVAGYAVAGDRTGVVLVLIRAYYLTGIVRHGSSSGPALPGATVTIAGKSAVTGSNGTFKITGIPAGSSVITISKAGYISRTFTGSIYVMSSNKSGIVFYLIPVCSFSGTVRQGSDTGPLVAGATVSIAGKSAITGSTGAFSFTGIPAGTYTVTISKSGYIARTVSGYKLNTNKSGQRFFVIPIYSVSGTVRQVNSAGPAVAGAVVSVGGRSVATGSTGAFSITGIPAGTYTVTISKSGYVTRKVTGYLLNANRTGLLFYLTPLYTVSGTVRQGSATGPVLAGAKVSLGGKSATSSSSGAFSITAVPAGSYPLTITRSGYISKEIPAYAVNSNKTGVVFYLTK